LASLVRQTLQDIEIICIDDKGTDNSFRVVEEFAKKDKRFHLVYNAKNLGIALSEQRGIDVAKGEYVAFLDPDDWVDLNYYERLYSAAHKRKYDIAKADRLMVYADDVIDDVHMNDRILYRMQQGLTLFSSWTFGWTTAIYKKRFLSKNHIRITPLNLGFDVVFLSEVLSYQPTCVLVENVFYYYLQRNTSITKRMNAYGYQSWMLYVLKICLLALNVPMDKDEYLEFMAHKLKVFLQQLESFSKIRPKKSMLYRELLAQTLFVSPYLSDMYMRYPSSVARWDQAVECINHMQKPLSTEEVQVALDVMIDQLNADGGNDDKE